jgi:penicillin-binding protein 1C
MRLSKVKKGFLLCALLFLGWFYWLLPQPLFHAPHSWVIDDENGVLLSAGIASDGQWRFPKVDSIPLELEQCVLQFEDEYFYYHPGVNPVSIFRAIRQNIKAGKVVSGGSTISMQVIRLSGGSTERTFGQKLIEMIKAVRLELGYSKTEILQRYLSHAPYGGNVVGAEAAAWRYFNRPLHRLSWAEYATLAVLPNAPSLIMPGKNAELLRKKRDRLLKKMMHNGKIDSLTYSLSVAEELPSKPHPLPAHAYHLLQQLRAGTDNGSRITTTIDGRLQRKVTQQLNAYMKQLKENKVHNACALVIDLSDGAVKAYVGNASYRGVPASYVDLIQAERSSGSILKPFLYAGAIEEGLIHPSTLLRDVPTAIKGFAPTNFNKDYEGLVQADNALARSLNVPATRLLKTYGTVTFYEKLENIGLTTLHRTPYNYGLSLILGGAEVSLWEIAQAYSNQARKLTAYYAENKAWQPGIRLKKGVEVASKQQTFTYGSWWQITEALTEVQRPGIEESWRQYSSSRKIAWKTGTSFGFRDAWAVGYDASYLVAVWVGNATGEGRPGLTGASTAAPLMFDVFQYLDRPVWFQKPEMGLKYVKLCGTTGMAPGPFCPTVETEAVMESKLPELCPYHLPITLNAAGQRVNRNCYSGRVVDTSWFAIDPIAAYYYKQKHPEYTSVPDFAEACRAGEAEAIAIVYPTEASEVIIPKDFDGTYEQVLAEAVHNSAATSLFWHLDDAYIGTTSGDHKLKLTLEPGPHVLSVFDSEGSKASVKFKAH